MFSGREQLHINSLNLINFRNINSLSFEFSPFLNILWGENGQGKTNIIESIYLIATSRSFRAVHDHELIFWNEPSCHIDAIVSKNSRQFRINADIFFNHLLNRSKKQIKVDNLPITKFSKLIGLIPIVLFTPQELEIVKGSPSFRRSYLDFILSQTSPFYLDNLQRYQTVIEQKNTLLREKGDKVKKEEITPWNDQIEAIGSIIIESRLNLTNKLSPIIETTSSVFSNENEIVKICYNSTVPLIEGDSKREQIEALFRNELEKRQKEETYRRQSLVGPHRDDLRVFFNNQMVKTFGSQGQQRSASLALKFAEWHYINTVMGTAPVLLLDDIFSELDENRSKAIFEVIQQTGQTFITTTEPSRFKYDNINLPVSMFKIVEGGSYVLTA